MSEPSGSGQMKLSYFGARKTKGGYTMDEVSSALQKTIRRGDEQQALFWATELDLSGYGNYAWKRLRIIASEDVGLGDPHLPATLAALYETWLDFKRKYPEYPPENSICMLWLTHAVLLLARAPKSRAVDNACAVMYLGDRAAMKMEIPDYALDSHTRRGRTMGRTGKNFYDETTKLENEADVDDPYFAIARAAEVDG